MGGVLVVLAVVVWIVDHAWPCRRSVIAATGRTHRRRESLPSRHSQKRENDTRTQILFLYSGHLCLSRLRVGGKGGQVEMQHRE